ncbi:MAG: hypothetical protein V4561_01550 [Bacteroidota bacterium]
MKKFINALIVLFVCFSSTSWGQFKFLPDDYSRIKTASDIKSATSWPYTMPPLEVNEWTDMSGRSSASPYTDDYEFKSMVDIVKIGVNTSNGDIVPAYKYQVSIKVSYKVATPSTGGYAVGSNTVVLYLSYDPNTRQKYNDLSVYRFSGAQFFEAEILDVQQIDPVSGALTPVAPSAIASNFFIEAEIHEQRYDRKPMYLVPNDCYLSPDARNIKTSCYLHTSPSGSIYTGTTEYKPASYELEWTYIDDYRCNVTTGEKSYAFTSSPASPVSYDFRKNSTRIQLDVPSYDIPLIYEHGAVVFRYRMIRPKFSNYKEIEYGSWTLGDYGTLSVGSTIMPFDKHAYIIQTPHTNDSLNWQYTINFAEQGKYKHVINYFDGSLKDRQTQTKINSDESNIIAVEKVYDYEGRPSIVSLPTPVIQNSLYYRKDILTHPVSGKPYKAADFDFLGCSRPGVIAALSTTSAANIYYSPLNPDKSDMQKFVPDAEGYPMVQTVYSPDNTNKVEWQGGAGKEQQLSEGHGTRYEYVRAVQPELDKFLGTEAGYDRFYPKQIVTDPNGQSSYSILNPQGKVVISALQSAPPDPTKMPISQLSNFVAGEEVCVDLLRNEDQEKLRNGLGFNTAFYNDGAGANTLTYSVKTFPFYTGCSGQYLWTNGAYEINVTDDCGKKYSLLSTTGTVSNPSIFSAYGATKVTDYGHSPGYAYTKTVPALSDPSVPQGKILIDKKITFSEYDIRNQVRGFVKANEPICFSPEEFFIRKSVEETEFPCKQKFDDPAQDDSPCDGFKQQMIDELYPDAKYGKYGKNLKGLFTSESPNSIFSVVEDLNPSASTTDYILGPTPQCAVSGCGTSATCADGKVGCSCTSKHKYPDRCCTQCLLNYCSCISFPSISAITGVTPRVEKVKCTGVRSRDEDWYGWRTPATGGAFFSPAPGSEIRDFGPPFGDPKIYYYFVFATPMECSCGFKDTVWGREWYTSPPEYVISEIRTHGERVWREITEDASFKYGDHECDHTFYDDVYGKFPGVKTYYRYQSECINYPDVVYMGKLYTSAEIKKLDPRTFIKMFNREMAEALLPLHPEYCKLLNCQLTSGTFEQTFSELETYQEAEAAGMFSLDDIVMKDPYLSFVGGSSPSSGAVNLLKFPYNETSAVIGSYTPSYPLTLDKDRLDIQSLAKVYCGAGNYEEMLACAASKYNTEIFSTPITITDPILKQRYFEYLQARYLSNRSMIKQVLLDYSNGFSCGPCLAQRMKLVDTPIFKGMLNYTIYSDGTSVEKIEEEEDFSKLPEWKKDLYLGKSTTIPSEFFDQYNADKEEFAEAEAEAIMSALKDCPISDRTTLQYQLKSMILAGTKITPDIIRESIIATCGGPSALNDLCNSFLVAYGLFPDAKEAKKDLASFSCGDPNLYTGLQGFLNRNEIKGLLSTASATPSSTSVTLSRGGISVANLFENTFMDYFGYPTPFSATNYTLYVSAKTKHLVPACTTDCLKYIEVQVNSEIPPYKSFKINIQQAGTPTISNDITSLIASMPSSSALNFTDVKCVNDDPQADNFGLIAQKTATIQAECTSPSCFVGSKYYVWNDQIDFMSAAPDIASLAAAINCKDIADAMTAFKTSDKSTHAYNDNVDHPYFEKVITNYLNYTFNKKFSYEQYRNLMEGCALSDKISFNKEVANVRIEFNSDADADAFKTQIDALGVFKPSLFRYKPNGSSMPVVFVDLNPLNDKDITKYMNYLMGTGGTLLPAISGVNTRTAHYIPSSNMLFTATDCPFSASVFASGTVNYSSSSVKVWENEENRDYTLHEFSSNATTPTPKQKADIIAAAIDYRKDVTTNENCRVGYAFYNTDYVRSADYSSPFKSAYLSYIEGLGTVTPTSFLSAIAPSALTASLTGYTTKSFSYNNPYCIGNRNHLYVYKPNPTATEAPGYDLVKNTIISTVTSGGSKLFPDDDVTYMASTSPGFKHQLAVIRKANGVYWYRYFDNTDNKLYNLYITPPGKKLARAPKDYTYTSIEMGPDPNTFVVTVYAPAVAASGTAGTPTYIPALPAVTTQCIGYANFPLSTTSLIASNVMLQKNTRSSRCFDSSDCERDLLATAILNGKAAYYQYFEENVARISIDYMNHLVATTKDTLTYCGRQQQYQQTLYYYDRVGNLTRTVPPMGVEPLPSLGYSFGVPGSGSPRVYGMDDAARYRDDPSLYFADLTYYPPGGGGPVSLLGGNAKLTNHRKVSEYRYNSLNQLVYQKTPDGGTTYFFYDAAGRQIFSQNSKQRRGGYYTYSLYDEQGRPEESGQVRLGCTYRTDEEVDFTPCETFIKRKKPDGSFETLSSYGAHPDFIINSFDEKIYPYDDLKYFIRSQSRQEVVFTHYDNMSKDLGAISDEMLSTQENLRARVEAIKYYNNLAPDWYYKPLMSYDSYDDATFSTYYSYDISGNVQTITYDFPELKYPFEQRYKRIDYDYDLVSGKVNMISYNRGHPDQFYQQYDYDADNRITQVNTSNDGLIWNRDAQYKYYKHGPLARLTIGQHQIQSLEYAYTIQGWLKAINGDVLDPAKDMGQNGLSADLTYPRDVVVHALRYFANDYKAIGTTAVTNVAPPSGSLDLYNGNISQQTTGIAGHGTMHRTYQYDQLQRLKLATNNTVDDAMSSLATTPADLFKSSYSYDMDGNITQLQRWDGDATSPVQIDNFTYRYQSPTTTALTNNKLLQVEDAAAATTPPAIPAGGEDLQPGQPVDNYKYDLTGNLVRDKQGAEHILWDRFGKVTRIADTASNRYIDFAYDGKGNRIWKIVRNPVVDGRDEYQGEYYVRDAAGNILSVYRTHSVYNRRMSIRPLVAAGSGTLSPTTTGGTVLTDVLTTFTTSVFPDVLRAKLIADHAAWVDAYTSKPISFYWAADPTLKSNLLFNGDAWIDDLRTADPGLYSAAFLKAGIEVQPLFFSALDHPFEGEKLLEHYSREMPEPLAQSIWATAQAPYIPASHAANANALYSSISLNPSIKPVVIDALVEGIRNNYADTLPEAEHFYTAVIADNALWRSAPLRDQNGPWTVGITNIVILNASDTVLSAFFDSWPGGSAAFAGIATPEYKLAKVYAQDPAGSITDMAKEASIDEITDIITDMPDMSPKVLRDGLTAADLDHVLPTDVLNGVHYGSSGDTISLAEHHIYGSSRLGVQRYDSTTVANILNLPEADAALVRRTLRKRVPWYSYSFADLIDSTQKDPYAPGLTGNAYLAKWTTSRTLGRRYYEMTDHLGNVLATVLDRKTGTGELPGSSGTLYDHWSADLASTADYYPGGMMMPGRNTEYSWSRMGFNGQAKDDEVYGKGNLNTAKFWEMDTRIIRRWNLDPVDQISISNYAVNSNNPIHICDPDGDCPFCVLFGKMEMKTSSLDRTTGFVLRHPLYGSKIGLVQHNSTNISTNSARFATNTDLPENSAMEGSHVNAYRHVLWQATITNKMGASIAKQVGNAHEHNPTTDISTRSFSTLSSADETIDLLNNEIGRELGKANPKATMQQLAIKTLKEFKDKGLYTATRQKDGSYTIARTKITDAQYNKALKTLNTTNDNGYTPKQQAKRDAEQSKDDNAANKNKTTGF